VAADQSTRDRLTLKTVAIVYAGWIALYSGVAGGADVILIPEIPFDLDKVARRIRDRDHVGARFSIVVVAEGARPVGGKYTVLKAAEGQYVERLGGVAARVAADLEALTGKERLDGGISPGLPSIAPTTGPTRRMCS
jgi:6-phosphofructokinase